jgi:hypothetical protein
MSNSTDDPVNKRCVACHGGISADSGPGAEDVRPAAARNGMAAAG